jgi:hypothetical protein
MHVLKDYPEVVKKIAFHEPPINTKFGNVLCVAFDTIITVRVRSGIREWFS